jgi:hypothetical protein
MILDDYRRLDTDPHDTPAYAMCNIPILDAIAPLCPDATHVAAKRSRQVRGGPGTNRVQAVPPNVDRRHRTFPKATGRQDRQGPHRRSPSRATSANAARSDQRHALAGRAGLRDGGAQESLRLGLGGQVWHPAGLPTGYHTAAQGQSHLTHAPVSSRAAPGPPRGRAAPGRRDATRATNVQDHQ